MFTAIDDYPTFQDSFCLFTKNTGNWSLIIYCYRAEPVAFLGGVVHPKIVVS